MAYEAKVIQIMIASPSDVQEERDIIRDIIHEWNDIHAADRKSVLLPISWETHSTPEMGDRGQAIINKQVLENSDILVAVFWTRLGTPTGTQQSGTVEEIMEHNKEQKPTMIYFSKTPVEMGSVDIEQYKNLLDFKKWCEESGLIQEYSSKDEFKSMFYRQLSKTIIRYLSKDNEDKTESGAFIYPSPTPSREAVVDNRRMGDPDLSTEAKILLVEASKDPNGAIIKTQTIGAFHVTTNHHNFVGNNDPRSRAKWGGAVDELFVFGYLKAEGYKREVFSITSSGYELADWLSSNLDIESLKQYVEGIQSK